MDRYSDKQIIRNALNIYYKYLKGFGNEDDLYRYDTLKRIRELQKKPMDANSVAVTIKLDAPDIPWVD